MDENQKQTNQNDLNQPSGVSINGWQLTNAGLIFMKRLGIEPDKNETQHEKIIDT